MSTSLVPRHLQSLAEVDAATWNALCGTDYPFLRHEFLLALESSGCVSARSGWSPCHLLLEDPAGQPVACLPLYARSNSWGEYVFDWAWADAYARHGLEYYPKLVTAIPFTPCAGPRLGLAPGVEHSAVLAAVLSAVQERARVLEASSWHLLFPDAAERERCTQDALLLRTGCQYQWFNRGYADFDAFLASLSSRKRKNLRKERAQVAAQGMRFRVLEGRDIQAAHWQVFFDFYASTYYVRGRRPYLNLDFFLHLGASMPEQIMLVLAEREDSCVAGALCFKGSDTLYGRYWGSSADYQFLHFETCYYQGIDYCIRHGLKRFDSGAQGEHKIQRGFEPVPTWSLHWIADVRFRDAIAHFVSDEAQQLEQYRAHAARLLPFRQEQ